MAREFADALYDRLIQTFPVDGPYAPEAFEEAPMPSPVAYFLRARLHMRLQNEIDALRAARSNWFDYKHPDVQAAGRAFRKALDEHPHIPPDAWEEELRTAVREVTDYLIQPARALARFTFESEEEGEEFEDEETRPVPVLLQRMELFAPYPYLRQAVGAHVQERNLETLERARLEALLARVDRQMTDDYAPDDWLRLLAPLFDLAETAFPEGGGVPADALRAFFAAKDAEGPQRRLGAEQTLNGTNRLDREHLHRLLTQPEELPDEKPLPAEPAPPPEPAPTHEARSAPETAPAPKTPPAPATPPAPVASSEASVPPAPEPLAPKAPAEAPARNASAMPRWKQFQPDNGAGVPAPSRPPDEQDPRPLWQRFRQEEDDEERTTAEGLTETTGTAPLDVLEHAVLGSWGRRNRALFIDRLFDGSEEEYAYVLRRLRGAPDWGTASQIIAREIFRKHQVNIYSDPAVSFTDAVEASFR